MVRTENFGFRLSPAEKKALLALAERDERDPSDVLRFLIRRAADGRGLLPRNQPIVDIPTEPGLAAVLGSALSFGRC